ncbi:MAG: hypothetical protein E7455_08965 [Ruminococcaceae bacterium]|nr:hypothetical protein [Oscillospiraceae bacterium]
MGCMKCGKKLGQSQVFCDECLEKMAQAPVEPGTVVKLPDRTEAPPSKKKPLRRLYFWEAEDEIGTLRSKIRWLTFALVVAVLGFLVAVAVIFLLLHWQGQLDILSLFR